MSYRKIKNIYCYYIDHSFFKAKDIGRVYNGIKKEEMLSDDSILVSTCQRIEVYNTKNENPLDYLPVSFRVLSEKSKIESRLISICAGIESQILGEKNIHAQIEKAMLSASEGNPLKDLFTLALNKAERIRQREEFFASADYEHMALEVLRSAPSLSDQGKLDLVVVGSGMLARNFADIARRYSYAKVIFITRSPKSLRKKMSSDMHREILCARDFLLNKTKSHFHCVIATNDLSESYAEEIYEVLTSIECLGVFDLSAMPVFFGNVSLPFYADSYSDAYLSRVNKYNEFNKLKSDNIRIKIESGIYYDI